MKELKLTGLVSLLALPAAWLATLKASDSLSALSNALDSLFLGSIPLLGLLLFWHEDFRPQSMLIRFGQDRRGASLLVLSRGALTLTAAGIVGALTSILVFRSNTDPSLLSDLLASSGIALASGLSLASFLAMTRIYFGKAGLLLALFSTWLLAPSQHLVSFVLPAGHIHALLGRGAEFPLSSWLSFGTLYAMTLFSTSIFLLRVPR